MFINEIYLIILGFLARNISCACYHNQFTCRHVYQISYDVHASRSA